jgi:hypothetical protein
MSDEETKAKLPDVGITSSLDVGSCNRRRI